MGYVRDRNSFFICVLLMVLVLFDSSRYCLRLVVMIV